MKRICIDDMDEPELSESDREILEKRGKKGPENTFYVALFH